MEKLHGLVSYFHLLHSQTFVHKILQSYDKEQTGHLTPEQVKAAMNRLRLGFSEEEKELVSLSNKCLRSRIGTKIRDMMLRLRLEYQ